MVKRLSEELYKSPDETLAGNILACIPQQSPFRFIDRILSIDENHVVGTYTFKSNESFYQGHFPDFPVTPGVILTETMAQIGLVALGVFLCGADPSSLKSARIFFTSSNVQFHKMVRPGDQVWVESQKEYFRLRKLQCKVAMFNQEGKKICAGTLSGMFSNP